MDPQAVYQELLDALRQHDMETARELAETLHDWLARGGFAPQPLGPETVAEVLVTVRHPVTAQCPADTAFTLVCEDCDAGQEIGAEVEAVIAGWTRLEFAPDLPQANFVGLCPACRRRWND